MSDIEDPTDRALAFRDVILKLTFEEFDRTNDTKATFHGLALAFGHVLSQVQPDPKDAAAWMQREAQRILLTGEQKGRLQ
jgi:hypothetical protein